MALTDDDPRTDPGGGSTDRDGTSGFTLRRRLAALLGISATVLIAASAILFSAQTTLNQRRDVVIFDVDPATLAARDLRAAMVDQETGVRGFVIAGDTRFLEPWDRGQAAELVAKSELEPTVDSDDELARIYERVRLATDAWQTQFASPAIDRTLDGNPGVNRSVAVQDEGQVLFDEVRSSIDALEQHLNEERTEAVETVQQSAQRVWTVAICVLIGLFALGVVIAVALKRSVTGPIIELADEVRVIARGDLDRRIEVEGTPEIERLAADIDDMRRQILAKIERLREANASVEAQSLELQRSNADLEQFAYVASHDLQEPLRKIAGFCQLLERRYQGQLDDRADEYIAFVVDGAKRMQDLINDLLAFSRVGRSTTGFEELELVDVVASAVSNLRVAIDESRAQVHVGELPAVCGDSRLLVALFQNLIANAVKFRGSDPPEVRITAEAVGDDWIISVADNGIGIDDEYAEQIFTIFQRLHKRTDYEGTGIGLALAKKIAEFHDGNIWLDTDTTVGATFRIQIPSLSPSARSPASNPDLELDRNRTLEPAQETTPW